MSRQNISLLTLPIAATAAITAETFITVGGAVATAAGNAIGVAKSDGVIGALVPTEVIGTAVATAGAAIAKGARVQVGTAGKAITLAAGVPVAVALEAAAADGDKIEVLLITN